MLSNYFNLVIMKKVFEKLIIGYKKYVKYYSRYSYNKFKSFDIICFLKTIII